MRLLLLILALSAHAADITVCASGCDQTTLAAALAAASRGDTVTMTAGETFEASTRLTYKGAGSGFIEIRSSRYAELPPQGTRIVGSTHSALMAKLQPPSTSQPVVYTTPEQRTVSAVNTGTDTITTDTHTFVDTEPVSFSLISGGTLPSPLVANTVYYARDTTSTTFKLALLPGDAAIDLGAGYAGTVYAQTSWVGSNYKFTGIEFAKKTGQDTLYTLVEIGRGDENVRSGIPSNFVFDRVYIHGIQNESGPTHCLMLNARNVTVTDSEISACVYPGIETKAITYYQMPGPTVIRNNLLESGSINLLAGGSPVWVPNLISGDEGQVTVTGNHFQKPMWMKYTAGTSGAGAPSAGSCPGPSSDSVNWYLRTSNGQWYTCTGNGTDWSTGPTCADGEYFRSTSVAQNCGAGACWSCASGVFTSYGALRGSGYSVKNLFELKSATNHFISGNIFNQCWNDAQSGHAVLLASKVDQGTVSNAWVNVQNIVFTNNSIYNSADGMRTATEGGTVFGADNFRIQAYNNLFFKIGVTDFPSIDSAPQGISFAGPCEDCAYDHNTLSNPIVVASGSGLEWDTLSNGAWVRPRLSNTIVYANQYGLRGDGGAPYTDFWGSGNIFNSVAVDNLSSQGAPSAFGGATNGNYITAATTLFEGSGNYRLQSTSPYSAKCASGCAYTGTDGKDLGADIDIVEAATQGASAGAPWLGGSAQVTPGSTRAVIRYTAPSSAACNLTLYNDIGRAVENADTNTSGEKLDSRTGNITDGTSRQFVLGTNTALTASTLYWFVIDCSGSTGYGTLRTLSGTGSGFDAVTKYPSAITGEYSSSADMSSPTAISSSASHTVPIPGAAVRYYRPTGGAIRILVAGGTASGIITWADMTSAWSTYTNAWSTYQ